MFVKCLLWNVMWSLTPLWPSLFGIFYRRDECFSALWVFHSHVWVDVSVHVVLIQRLSFVKYFVRRSEPCTLVFFLFKHRHRRVLNCFRYVQLSFNHCWDSTLVVAETNFYYITLSHVFVFVCLGNLLLFTGVHLEMVVGHNNFLVPVVDLLLLLLSFFFHHIVAWDKNSIEISSLGESSSLGFHFSLEFRLSILPRDILESLKFHFGFPSLLVVRDPQILDSSLIRSLWMLVPVLTLHHVIKPTLGFPSTLIFFLCFLSHFIFINYWESKTEVISRVSIKLWWIFGNLLS